MQFISFLVPSFALSLLCPLWPAQLHRSSSAGPDHSSVPHKALACRWKKDGGVYSRIRKFLYMPQRLRNALLPHSRTGSDHPDQYVWSKRNGPLRSWTAVRGSYCKPHVKMFTCMYCCRESGHWRRKTRRKEMHMKEDSEVHSCFGFPFWLEATLHASQGKIIVRRPFIHCKGLWG